jgi:drug/metabolite transporter (DMT)-like permease
MYGEKIRLPQYIGIGILFVAVILMCSYNNALKGKITIPAFLLLILCGTASGFADFSQKLLIKTLGSDSVSVFNFYTYVFASLTLIIAFFLARNDGKATDIRNLGKMSIYILIMAICLFVNSYFKTLAASSLSSVILYPLNQGMSLVLSSAMAAVVFKERLNLKAIIGIFAAFAGLLIINLM